MLWLCIYLPRLSLEAIAAPEETSLAIFINEKNKRRIICSNLDGTTNELATALAIHTNLRPLERNACAESAALQRLAAWAYQWSSYVTWREAQPHLDDYSALLWLEIGASRTLFGGYTALVRQLEHSLRALRYTYHIGVAPTLEGSAVLARAGQRVLITSEERLRLVIRKLPIVHLALAKDILYALKISGITTIGTLLDIPAAAIARRFGPKTSLYFERLVGSAADPRPAYRLPNKYRERSDFGFGIETVTALLFPLQRMLHEFCGYLRALDIATQNYCVIFEHERSAVTRVQMGLATPSRDAKRLFATARERLHTLTLAGSVYGMRIEAAEFTAPAVRQQGLFANDTEVADELGQTLEKITARLGPDAVRELTTAADYRPERAWQFVNQSANRAVSKSQAPETARPLWLLPEPFRLPTPPKVDAQCETIEAGWWNQAIKRDYYIAHTPAGERCWVFFDPNDCRWYLQGFWA